MRQSRIPGAIGISLRWNFPRFPVHGSRPAAKKIRRAVYEHSHIELGDSGKPTGFYYEELTDPYCVFEDAGFDIELALVKDSKLDHDPGSLPSEEKLAATVRRFLADSAGLDRLATTIAISDIDATGFDGIFLAGGHGAMWDLPGSAPLASLLGQLNATSKVIAAVWEYRGHL